MPLFEGLTPDFGLVGDSPEIQRVRQTIQKLRGNRSPVLLLGESGTGKEVVARALHAVSPGWGGAFVAVNVATIPPALGESELFGHARGSFTGATGTRKGLIEQARQGTLFLDEIGELPLEIQAKLLRALEENEIRPLGAERAIRIETRVIAATNRELAQEVEQGRFRADLFYRLNVISIRLAPLRRRRQDIAPLARHFLRRCSPPLAIDEDALRALEQHDWPGNVRELDHCLQRMAALCSGEKLEVKDLPTQVRNAVEGGEAAAPRRVAAGVEVVPMPQVERMAIERAMTATRGDRRKAAVALGVGRTTLYRKLKQFGWEGRWKEGRAFRS